MKFKLSGFSTPIAGLSWDNCDSTKDKIKQLFFYLESKRILTNPISMELPEECIQSVLEIKSELVDLGKSLAPSETVAEIRKMITASNKYLDKLSKLNLPTIIYKDNENWEDRNFDSAMKNFRKTFRASISRLAEIHSVPADLVIPEKW